MLHLFHSSTTHSIACLFRLPRPPQVSDKMDPAQLVSLIASLNPDNTPGRLAVIVRMGAEKLRLKFPALIEAVEQAGQVRQQQQELRLSHSLNTTLGGV